MKIAQLAPLIEAVPPKLYGGTERVVAYLTDALVDLGHEVTLFASGDSVTKGKLAPIWPRSLRLDPSVKDQFVPLFMQLETVARRAHEFDVIHAHIDYFGYPLLQRLGVPSVTTLHGRLDLPELPSPLRVLSRRSRGIHLELAARPLPQANYVATVLHGLPQDLLAKGDGTRRLPRVPGPDLSRKGAGCGDPDRRAGRHAAEDRGEGRSRRRGIFQDHDRAACSGTATSSSSARSERTRKRNFLGNAAALLFPIAWREPFGLVMIESMACGTPVVAFENGSVPEVLEDGVTGFIVHDERQAVEAVGRAVALDRNRIRAEFDRRFTARRMAQNYVSVYSRLAKAFRRTGTAQAQFAGNMRRCCNPGQTRPRRRRGRASRYRDGRSPIATLRFLRDSSRASIPSP